MVCVRSTCDKLSSLLSLLFFLQFAVKNGVEEEDGENINHVEISATQKKYTALM